MLLIILAVCVVLLIGAGAYLMFSGDGFNLPFGSPDNQASTGPEDEQPADSEPEEEQVKTELGVAELLEAYQNDTQAAISQYKDEIVTITGKVSSLGATEGWVLVTENGDPNEVGARCTLLSSEVLKLEQLLPEQIIKVKGTVGDYIVDIYINDCIIIQ
jgi:hypothetical protein